MVLLEHLYDLSIEKERKKSSMLHLIICACIGYSFGCFSTGYIVGKMNHIDIRQYGSGNAGTTNAIRTLGFKAGIITFLGDLIKALLAIFVISLIFANSQMPLQLLKLYAGLGVVIGHNFPFYLHFKGGKGIAATAGVMFAFDWRLGVMAALIFIITVAITRYVSLGSLIISLILPIWIVVLYKGDVHMLMVGLLFTILAFLKHNGNIIRLIKGTENKLGEKAKIK